MAIPTFEEWVQNQGRGGHQPKGNDAFLSGNSNRIPTFNEYAKTNGIQLPKQSTPAPIQPHHNLLQNFGHQLGGVVKDVGHTLSEVGQGLKGIEQGLNPFDNFTWKDVANRGKQLAQQDKNRLLSSPLSSEISRGFKRAVDAASFNNLEPYQKSQGLNVNWSKMRKLGHGGVTDFLTSGVGYVAPGTLSADLTKLGTQALIKGADNKLLGKGAKLLNNSKIARGATEGALFSGLNAIANPNETTKQKLQDAALFTGVGAVADPLISGLGKVLKKTPGIKNIFDKLSSGKITKQEATNQIKNHKEFLALPAPEQKLLLEAPKRIEALNNPINKNGLLEPQKALPNPIMQRGLKYKNGKEVNVNGTPLLPQPKTQRFVNAKTANYGSKLDKLITAAKQLQSDGKLTPGREYETLKSMWSNMASSKDPSFDNLLKLANPSVKMNQVKYDPLAQLKLLKQARQNQKNSVYGLNNSFNKLNFKQEYVPAPKQDGKPLQFKREQYNQIVDTKPLNFTGKLNPNTTKATKAVFTPPKVNNKLLNSLNYGDKVVVRKDRGQTVLSFVKRDGNNVVLQKNNGKNIVVPAEMVVNRSLLPKLENKLNVGTPIDNRLKFKKEVLAKNNQPELFKGLKPKSNEAQSLNINSNQSVLKTANQTNEVKANNSKEKYVNISSPKEPKLIDTYKENSKKNLLDGISAKDLKDIGGFKAYTSDVYRNFQDVFKNHFNTIKKRLLDPFDKAKGELIDLQHKWANKLNNEVVKGLGIKKDSPDSALVQQYGEGKITLNELKAKAPNQWQNIVSADKWFRKAYDELLTQVNKVRKQIYGENTDKIVPKRGDYYRHFKELNGLEGFKNLFDTPAGIDPNLVGVSDFTQPNSKFAGFMQKRGNGKYKNDAVGGFLNYLPAATYAIKIDPFIPAFKKLAKELEQQTGDTKHLNTFIEYLRDFSRDLAGKTNIIDRPFQKVFGRKTFQVLHKLNSRVKSNVVLGNASSALAQIANVPQGIAFAKHYSIKGMYDTLRSTVAENKAIKQSNFIKERYGHSIFNQFDTKALHNVKNFAGWMLEASDKIGTAFIWNSAYEKGLAKGVENPIKYADDATRKLVAGRGIGEVPLAQKSKIVQLIAPFQLEVANLWRVQKDFMNAKDFGGLITLYLASYLLNKGISNVRGSGVTFDPIKAIQDAFTEKNLTPLEKGGRLAGEVLSNLPLGQTLSNFYPEYGTKTLPTRKQLFGNNDPNRYGSGLLIAKGAQDPFFKVLPPFGGNQLEKTFKVLRDLHNKGVYNKDKSKLKYPVLPTAGNESKGLLFGPGAFKETQNYYDNKLSPLGTNQTKQYEQLKKIGKGSQFYNQVIKNRDINKLTKQFKAIETNKKLSDEAKKKKLQDLIRRLRNLKQAK